MKIVVDAMGGDHAPGVVVAGVVEAVRALDDVDVVLVGREDTVAAELKKHVPPEGRIEIVHASQVVGMDEPATVSVRRKRDSSIARGVRLLKDEGHAAFISAGNTGAVVDAATVTLGMIPGVERPGIGLVIPTLKNFAILMDVGATPAPKPTHLMQWALMAGIYCREVLGVARPRIGLLNIGEEACKGSDFVKDAHRLMVERIPDFIGNVEASEIFSGKADCIITDGFVGNTVIKVSEGLMESAAALLKREIVKSPPALLGAWLMKSRLQHIKRYADYSEYGGAPLLGVNGNVMISHGRSNAKAIANAIRVARREIRHEIVSRVKSEIGRSS